jgi:chemotaxis family two-component system response regulator Rcp1
MGPGTFDVLLVDDDAGDVELTRLMLRNARLPIAVRSAENGRQALDRLAAAPRPDLILLDLHMPVMDGLDFLRARQQRPELQHIPVLMLTHSQSPAEADAARRLGAVAFLSKPTGSAGYTAFIAAVEQLLRALPGPG